MIKDIHVLVHVDIRKQIMRFEKNVGDISCKMKDVTQWRYMTGSFVQWKKNTSLFKALLTQSYIILIPREHFKRNQ